MISHDTFPPALQRAPLEACPRCRNEVSSSPFCQRCGFDLHHGSPKAITSGSCLYCDFFGSLSKEHIYGKWIHERYPKPVEQRYHQLARPVALEFFGENNMDRNTESHRGSGYSVFVPNVCEGCNNGWMSQLHIQAKPIVSRFTDGFWPNLSSAEAEIFSRWLAMVTINIESKARIPTISAIQRQQLRNGAVPDGFQIAIGRIKDLADPGFSFHRALKAPIYEISDYMTLQSTVFCIEALAVHAMSAGDDRRLDLARVTTGFGDTTLKRVVWPRNEPAKLSNKRAYYTVENLTTLQTSLE